MTYAIRITVHVPYEAAVAATRDVLAVPGFGILTEIDLRATLKQKLDVDIASQVVLGDCRPQLAHQALGIDPSITGMLPRSVVVRSIDNETTVVEAFDPNVMAGLAGDAFHGVAADARERLVEALGGDR